MSQETLWELAVITVSTDVVCAASNRGSELDLEVRRLKWKRQQKHE